MNPQTRIARPLAVAPCVAWMAAQQTQPEPKPDNREPKLAGLGAARPSTGPIAEYNQQHGSREQMLAMLARAGFKDCGEGRVINHKPSRRLLSSESSTGEPGGVLYADKAEPWHLFYNHHGSGPLVSEKCFDPFDLFTEIEHNGNQQSALAALERSGKATMQGSVLRALRRVQGASRECVDLHRLAQLDGQVMYVGPRNKYMQPDAAGYLNQYTPGDFTRHVLKGGHAFLNHGAIPDGAKADDAAEAVRDGILSYLINHCQVETIQVEVDMFIDSLSIARDAQGTARLVTPFKLLSVEAYDPNIIADYREHFPPFDDFLKLCTAARFASDRRKAYLWLHFPANWGKGLIMAALKAHGLVLEITEAEIEKALAGNPIGVDLKRFATAWILFVDEFRKIKAELKMLNSEISGAPKNMLRTTIPTYVKAFASAEDIPSLTGEAGVERQFADRFCYMSGKGSIDDRPLFRKVGKEVYRRALSAYIAEELNAAVAEYRALGKEAASKRGDDFLDDFHRRWGIGNEWGSLGDTVEEIAHTLNAKIRCWLEAGNAELWGLGEGINDPKQLNLLVDDEGRYFLIIRGLGQMIDRWIDDNFGPSERPKLHYKRQEILALLGDRQAGSSGRHNLREVVAAKAGLALRAGERKKARGVAFKCASKASARKLAIALGQVEK